MNKPFDKTIKAPSKIMLTGEYWVTLSRGQSIAVATPPYLTVDAEGHPVDAIASDYWNHDPRPLSTLDQNLHPLLHELFLHAREFTHHRRVDAPTRLLIINRGSQQAFSTGTGSSAQLVLGGIVALLDSWGISYRVDDLFRVGLSAHSRAQGNHGSGYDLATILLGGFVHYTNAGAGDLQAHRLLVPPAFSLGYVTTGIPAPTEKLLQSVNLSDSLHGAEGQALATSIRAVIAAWGNGAKPLLAALSANQTAYERWATQHHPAVLHPRLIALLQLVRSFDLTGKISGAGGGDGIVVATDDRERLLNALRRLRESGYAADEIIPADRLSAAIPA